MLMDQEAQKPESLQQIEKHHQWYLTKVRIILIIIVTIILLSVLSTFGYFYIQSATPQPTKDGALIPTPTPTGLYLEPTGSAAMANWKTYKNDTYGISFSYPINWELNSKEYAKEKILSIQTQNNDQFELSIFPLNQLTVYKNEKYSNNEELIEELKRLSAGDSLYSTSGLADWEPRETKKETINIDNIQGISYTFSFLKPYKSARSDFIEQIWIYGIYDNKLIHIVLKGHSPNIKRLSGQILSTFKFTQ